MHARTRATVLGFLGLTAMALVGPRAIWSAQPGAPAGVRPEATSLLGRPLYAIELAPDAKKTAEANLQAAREALARAPGSADAMVWLGRRAAVAGHVREAIDVFTGGIAKFPADARFYRHRGQAKPRVDEPSLVARLRQFVKDNPTSPKLASVYSSLLSAAARDADAEILLEIAGEAAARFPQSRAMANDITNAMRTFRDVRGETAAKALAEKLIKAGTNPQVLLSAAQAFPGSRLRLLERAIAVRRTVGSADAPPTLEDLRWAYVDALDRAGHRDESARLQKDLVEHSWRRIAELEALPAVDPARSSLPLLRASLANRYITLADQALSARQYQQALGYVTLSEESGGGHPLEFATRCDERRAAIHAAMKRPDLELESWVKVFANRMEIGTRERIRELAVQVGRKPEDMLQRARDIRARSARPVAGFELKTPDGPPLALASLTSMNKATLFSFFFPT